MPKKTRKAISSQKCGSCIIVAVRSSVPGHGRLGKGLGDGRLDGIRRRGRAAEPCHHAGSRIDGDRLQRTECLRSEEHTSELQYLMRTSYAGLCLKNNIITVH